jgi:hypothetical protein
MSTTYTDLLAANHRQQSDSNDTYEAK